MSHPFDETARLIGDILEYDRSLERRGLAGLDEAQRRRLRAEAAELRRLARDDRMEAAAGLLIETEPDISELEMRALWGDR